MSLITVTGLVGATVTVTATTLDDAIWLVPYVGSSSWSFAARVAHAIIFVLTLESLAIASVLVAFVIQSSVTQLHNSTNNIEDTTSNNSKLNNKRQEILLGSIAAGLCWLLAIFFFVKKLLKRRRRRLQKQQQEEEQSQLISTNKPEEERPDYEATIVTTGTDNSDVQNQETEATNALIKRGLTCSNIGTVISLTTLGALDELSYFPTLILGKIFTPMEICLGTFFAASLILVLVTCCLARCKPLADCLDQIPIYAVIALFATILTCGVLYDAFWDDN